MSAAFKIVIVPRGHDKEPRGFIVFIVVPRGRENESRSQGALVTIVKAVKS